MRFSIEPDCAFNSLEMVLAAARRINLKLLRMQVRADRVWLELDAADEDPLTLFGTRVQNVIGVYDIVSNVCTLPVLQK